MEGEFTERLGAGLARRFARGLEEVETREERRNTPLHFESAYIRLRAKLG